jgi:hypothetical protein
MYIWVNAPIVAGVTAITIDITLSLPLPLSPEHASRDRCQSEPLHATHSRPMLQQKIKIKITTLFNK